MVHVLSCLVAYAFRPGKPAILNSSKIDVNSHMVRVHRGPANHLRVDRVLDWHPWSASNKSTNCSNGFCRRTQVRAVSGCRHEHHSAVRYLLMDVVANGSVKNLGQVAVCEGISLMNA